MALLDRLQSLDHAAREMRPEVCGQPVPRPGERFLEGHLDVRAEPVGPRDRDGPAIGDEGVNLDAIKQGPGPRQWAGGAES